MFGYVAATGCSSLQPVLGQPMPIGMVLSLSINDAGRVGLANQMGQNITEIEGRLVQRDSAAYVLAVAQIETYRGGVQVWTGEHVRINNDFVSVAREKKFSRTRTALVGAAALTLVAVLASQSLFGGGSTEVKPPTSDSLSTIRIPLFTKK